MTSSIAVPQRAAVLGTPIDHSLSPLLYRTAFAALGMDDWSFDAIEVDAAGLGPLVGGLDASWRGLAVTMPGKAAAAAAATSRSDRVALLQVANTLLRSDDGWHADNTDIDGVVGAVRAAGLARAGPVLLLGAGGTARAVVAALAELRWDGPVTVAARRPAATAAVVDLARTVGLSATGTGLDHPGVAACAEVADLVVSTLPAGACGRLAPLVARVPTLFDVIYDPWPTPLAVAGAPDRITISGLDMLLHQALRQFELVTGVAAPMRPMEEALRRAVAAGRSR